MRFSSTTRSASRDKPPPPTSRSPSTSPLGCPTSSRPITRSSTKRPLHWTEPDSSCRRISPAQNASVDPSPQRRSLEAGAVSELQGIARFKFHEGKLEEFKRLAAQCMEIVRTKDTGTLQYEIYFNDDQSECIVQERYRDSEALVAHAAHLGDLSKAIVATGFVAGELLGERSAE